MSSKFDPSPKCAPIHVMFFSLPHGFADRSGENDHFSPHSAQKVCEFAQR
jgi:hypothetical protein